MQIEQSCFLCQKASKDGICPSGEKTVQQHSKRGLNCACELSSDLDYCGQCLREKPNFDRAYTLFSYNSTITYLIKQFKYHNQLFLGKFFANKLKQKIEFIYQNNTTPIIIAMPLHKNKTKSRGFNQVLELLPSFKNPTYVRRVKPTKSFASLKKTQREKEIKNAFKVIQSIPAEHILLVDDVMTTGTSFSELAKTIKKHNPNIKQIDVLSLART
eukprot:GHVR01041058.1.p1 GENE.GHVR01041058.1~~GHVR01041058.1.p1  ORF type:complete len:215 (+),score=17.35 GHVR01041058.1:132-776(+)